jgi:hypothetical protein
MNLIWWRDLIVADLLPKPLLASGFLSWIIRRNANEFHDPAFARRFSATSGGHNGPA